MVENKSLIFVLGKGGVGRSTITRALGHAGARLGRRTIICAITDRIAGSRSARSARQSGQPYKVARNLWSLSIDFSTAFDEWIGRQRGAIGLIRTIGRSQAMHELVNTAPGARELITVAKVWDLTRNGHSDDDELFFDLVIVDCPASGHGLGMLSTPRTWGDMARIGPIYEQAEKVRRGLEDKQSSGYLLVCAPEESPVNETIQTADALRHVRLHPDAVIMNSVVQSTIGPRDLKPLEQLIDENSADQRALMTVAQQHVNRTHEEKRQLLRAQKKTSLPVVKVPFAADSLIDDLKVAELGIELNRELRELNS